MMRQKGYCKICGEQLGEWATYPHFNGNYHVACADRLVSWFRAKGYMIDFSSLEILSVSCGDDG